MKRFSNLFYDLENTSQTNKKVTHLKHYFKEAPDQDKVWAIALFTHRRPKRQVSTRLLISWAIELAGLEYWVFEESYQVVGDLAETIALIVPDHDNSSSESLSWWINLLLSMQQMDEPEKKEVITGAWKSLDKYQRFVFTKLITGGFRVGVSASLLIKALSEETEIDTPTLAHRLMGNWDPAASTYQQLVIEKNDGEDLSRPFPFYLAYSLDVKAEELGPPEEWQAEWKWDGIRSQVIVRNDQFYLWSRGEELITGKFPELRFLQTSIPDGTVIDGELLPVKNGIPLPFSVLQTRIGRKNISKKTLQEAPAGIFAYDLLEWKGEDIRRQPLSERRKILVELLAGDEFGDRLAISPALPFTSWKELEEIRVSSREHAAEGIMLKRFSSDYKTGRKRGDWWKWKIDPMSIDAVLVYAQKGHGRRADIYSDYTFAVWDGDQLISFAKAYSGLTDQEMNEVSKFVRLNTKEKFGPVRTVKPKLVFEIGFEGIQESRRHKSGIAVRFPRILRWRKDKKADEANTLEDLHSLLLLYK